MAAAALKKTDQDNGPILHEQEKSVSCGLIMPISATENHDEKHWGSVQTLLHRGIKGAGLHPANVWEGVNDRISKRIVSNIFREEIVVADISDLNPNVMLELGLRLASKKPTVIVFNKGGRIPFDIADVEVISYPSDLNILEMEAFFDKFIGILKSRLAAYRGGSYKPYLSDVVVEVIEPQTKEVSLERVILERIEDFGGRLSRIERQTSTSVKRGNDFLDQAWRSKNALYATVPSQHKMDFSTILESYGCSFETTDSLDVTFFKIFIPLNHTLETLRSQIEPIAYALSGVIGIQKDPS